MTPEQLHDLSRIAALQQIAKAITDTVKEAGPLGAPGGTLYAALMTCGCSLHQFEQIMAGLVRAKQLRKDGDLYFVAKGGRA